MANPFGDEEVTDGSSANPYGDDEVKTPGFFTAAKRGFEASKMGYNAMNAQGASDMISKLDKLAAEGDTAEVQRMANEDLLFANHYNTWKMSGKKPESLAKIREQALGAVSKSMGKIQEGAVRSAALPASPEYEEFQGSQTAGDAFSNFAKAPLKNMKEILGESLGGQAMTMPATAAAGVATGPAGIAAVQGASSAFQEQGSGVLELLMKEGIDVNDAEAVATAMNSPKFKAAAAEKMKKAAVVGAFDALTAAATGVKFGGRQAVNVPAQMGVQAAGGMVGEAAGSVAAGEDVNPAAVLAEGLGEVPGAGAEVASATINKGMRMRALQAAAKAKEQEAITGLAPAQFDADMDRKGQQTKPKLSALQSQIVVAAATANVDPQAALTIASIETGGRFDPTAKNPTSSAHGIFQMLDKTWEDVGGGDRNDVAMQIQNGLRSLDQTRVTMRRLSGRDPTGEELYMGHLFGPSMATTLGKAEIDDPQGSLLDAVRKIDPQNAEAIVKNNGLSGLTLEQGLNKIRGWYAQHRRRLGGDQDANDLTQAGPLADAAPHPEGQSPDEILDEIDAMLAEVELRAPTEADKAEALAENGPEVMAATDAEVQNIEFDEEDFSEALVTPVAPQEPILPRDLAGAKPRYGVGKNLYEVNFDSDVDRAAYVIANGAKRSARDSDYLRFVMDNTGMDEREARDYGQTVRRSLGALAREVKDPNVTSLTLARQTDRVLERAESGTTREELLTRARTENPNDRIPLKALPIINEGLEGQTLMTKRIEPGEVIALGVDSAQTPLPYMKAMRDTMQQFVAKFAPTARLAVSFKTEDDGSVSNYTMMARMGKSGRASGRTTGLYHINMRTAKNLGRTQDGTQNTTTQRKIAYATYHELGHMLADHKFTENMGPETLAKFRADGAAAVGVYFDESDFAGLSSEQVAVLQDYNDLKRKVLTDPKFTTAKFMDAWLSPWKLGHGWGKDQGKVSFLRKFYGETGHQMLDKPAKHFAETLHNTSKILNPHEYFAEQMARYAYSSRMADSSPLAVQFFKRAMETLRQFFSTLKRQGDIRPGTAFAEWVDSLTRTTQEVLPQENKAVPAPTRAVKPRIKLKPAEVRAAKKAEAPQESLLPPPDTAAKIAQQVISTAAPDPIRAAMQLMETDKGLKALKRTLPKKYNEFVDLIQKGRLDDWRDQATVYMDDEVADKVRWDTDNADHMNWRDVELNIVKTLPKRAGVKHWLGNGLRRLSDRKHYIMTMRQMAFEHVEVAGLQTIDMMMTAMKAYKAKLELRAVETSSKWSKLAKEQAGLLEQAMREEHANGEHVFDLQVVNKTWRFVPTAETLKYASAKGLDEQTLKIWLDVKNSHLQHMNALQNVLRQKIQKRFEGRPKTQAVKIAELHQMFQAIRGTPFIPQTRFGEWALQVVEPGVEGDQIVHIEFFESAAMRDEARAHLEAHVGKGRKVRPAHYPGSHHILRTLPPQVLSTYAAEFDLTETEKRHLREIADVVTKNPQTRRYSMQLAQITGANKSLLRNYADFMWHNANNITKLFYGEHLRRGLRMIAEDMRDAAVEGDFARHDRLKTVNDFAHSYVQHMLSPADEWQAVRAFVVVKMLWGNVKTALVNLSSLTHLWSIAATQHGIVGGTGATAKAAFTQLNDSIHRTMQRIARQPVEGGQVFSPDQRWAMNMAKVDGLLDESFAAQLAQFSNASTLGRLNMSGVDGSIKKAIWLGMLPQHAVEHYMRRVTLQTMFDLYMKQGETKENAYAKAKRDVYLTQGDNTLLNRPAFMRGKVAAMTIFYGFVQNTLYLLSGAQEKARNLRNAIDSGAADNMTADEARAKFHKRNWVAGETTKMWMAYLAMGGLMGLPGAEDLDNLLELVAKQFFGARFSLKEYAYKLASTISEEASSIGLDITPRSIVHGNMSDFSMFGLLPSVDISPSVGLGQAIPGMGGLDKVGKRGGAGEFVLGAMGPLGSTIKQFADIFGDDPALSKKLGFLPNTVLAWGKAWNEWEHGVMYPSGGKVTADMKTGELRDLTTGENLARFMGFQPAIVTANKELHWMQKDAADYWTARRNGLVAQAWEAKLQNDREAIADARAAIDDFNDSVKDRALKIGGKDLVRSFKARKKNADKDTERESRIKRYNQLFGDIEGDFTGRRSEDD